MCLFPRFFFKDKVSFERGFNEIKCGGCPECLSAKARYWALRSMAQIDKNSVGMMMTLTYDSYVRDSRGNIVGESVDAGVLYKKDAQDFIKRLRYYTDKEGIKIKYIIAGEHGKRTNRRHLHALIFGYQFNDLIFYKRSKRGNIIYTSNTLNKIWKNGICTVDSIKISTQVARYCTKYCAKDTREADDTFMLFSRGIGDESLLEKFNYQSYIYDGIEYPIPKLIWNKFIEKYNQNNYVYNRYLTSYKYIPREFLIRKFGEELGEAYFKLNIKARRRFSNFKWSNPYYQKYLKYWKEKEEYLSLTRPSAFERIRRLPDDKYFAYKQKALEVYDKWRYYNYSNVCPVIPPRSNNKSRYYKWLYSRGISHLPRPSCHIEANDRTQMLKAIEHDKKYKELESFNEKLREKGIKNHLTPLFSEEDAFKDYQLSIN